MASTFFNKPQLGQASLSNAQQTSLPSNDIKAETKARQAAESIDRLSGYALKGVETIKGKYLENIHAKNRIASSKQRPSFIAHVEDQIAQTKNFESLGDKGLKQKYEEYSESFLELHKDKPYASQLKKDMDQMGGKMLGNMLKKRDALHTQIVFDATAEGASSTMQMFSEGLINKEQFSGRIAELSYDSTLAFQVPSSSGLDLSEESRGKYQGLTRQQSNDAILRGAMIQTGKPNNSKVADMLADKEFRKSMGILDTDEDYNKLVAIAYEKGARADKVNYETGLDGLKESLYTKTNQGFSVNIDKELQEFLDSGKSITAQDESKLRKTFKDLGEINTTAVAYREGLRKSIDLSAGLPRKQKESIFERAFTDVLGINNEGISIDSVISSLSTKDGQVGFSEYVKLGGKVPDKFVQMFDVPAGASAEKWSKASAALATLQAASTGSGQSIEEIIGVNQVSKIRGMSRIYNDPDMEASVKSNAISAFQTNSTNFNSKGYLKGNTSDKLDPEWLLDVSKDAPWTTDDYVSYDQNSDEIANNYYAYRLAGNSDKEAKELSLDLFNKSNRPLEMANGDEIVVPTKHKYLNNMSIEEFSKSVDSSGRPRFPSIKQQRDDLVLSTGQGWISDWRARTNISFQKAYNFGKTGNYNMLYDGKLVDNSTFSYKDLEDFIDRSPSKLREKMVGGKHQTLKEVSEEAQINRKKNIKSRQSAGQIDLRVQSLYDLKI